MRNSQKLSVKLIFYLVSVFFSEIEGMQLDTNHKEKKVEVSYKPHTEYKSLSISRSEQGDNNSSKAIIYVGHKFFDDCNLPNGCSEELDNYTCNCIPQYISACDYYRFQDYKTPTSSKTKFFSEKKCKELCSAILPVGYKIPLSEEQLNKFMTLTKTFVLAMDYHNLTYFLSGGTLLGSYRHHGFIPWDDDMDVFVAFDQQKKIEAALKSFEYLGYRLWTDKQLQWKFYREDYESPNVNLPWKWPALDLFFYKVTKTDIIAVETANTKYVYDKKHIFPLKLRPFCNMYLFVPKDPMYMFQQRYSGFDISMCIGNSWNHQIERRRDVLEKVIPCERFYSIYPFVTRTNNKEILKVGSNIIGQF